MCPSRSPFQLPTLLISNYADCLLEISWVAHSPSVLPRGPAHCFQVTQERLLRTRLVSAVVFLSSCSWKGLHGSVVHVLGMQLR